MGWTPFPYPAVVTFEPRAALRSPLFSGDASRYHPPIDAATFIWLFIVLKLPIIAALLLVWYAVKEPEPNVDDDAGRGGSDRDPGHGPSRPRPPRRGPHASPPPAPPPRVRTAAGRKLTHRS